MANIILKLSDSQERSLHAAGIDLNQNGEKHLSSYLTQEFIDFLSHKENMLSNRTTKIEQKKINPIKKTKSAQDIAGMLKHDTNVILTVEEMNESLGKVFAEKWNRNGIT